MDKAQINEALQKLSEVDERIVSRWGNDVLAIAADTFYRSSLQETLGDNYNDLFVVAPRQKRVSVQPEKYETVDRSRSGDVAYSIEAGNWLGAGSVSNSTAYYINVGYYGGDGENPGTATNCYSHLLSVQRHGSVSGGATARLRVDEGGTVANIVVAHHSMDVYSGSFSVLSSYNYGTLTDSYISISNPYANFTNGGTIRNCTIDINYPSFAAGEPCNYLIQNGSMASCTINGYLYQTGGTVSSTTVTGVLEASGGRASNVTVNGTLLISGSDFTFSGLKLQDESGEGYGSLSVTSDGVLKNPITCSYLSLSGNANANITIRTDLVGKIVEKNGISRRVFDINLGTIGNYALKDGPDIIIDFGNSLKDVDEGTIQITGAYRGGRMPIHFVDQEVQFADDRFTVLLGEDGESFIGFYYNASMFGEAFDVVWFEHGDEEEYFVELPDECMQGASENVLIQERMENGSISSGTALPANALEDNRLKVSTSQDSGDLVISAQDKGQLHQCDLELWTVPEVLPGLDKKTTGKFAELLKKYQGNACSVSLTWPNIETSLLGIDFNMSDMGVNFTVKDDREVSLKMQGKLEWAIGDPEAGDSNKLVFDLAGDNYIALRMPWKKPAVLDVVGSMTCPDFKIGQFGFSKVSLKLDTTTNSWGVGAYITLPGIKYSFGGEIGIKDGCWDSLTIGVGNLAVPLGTTGLMLQSISGTVKDMASSVDMTFGGSLGLTYGPSISIEGIPEWLGIEDGEYSLCELEVSAEICTDGTLTGTASLTGLGNLISGSGTVKAQPGSFSLSGQFGLLNNCLTVNGEFNAGKGGSNITGTGRAQLPNETYFGFLAGTGFSTTVYADFDERYVQAWREVVLFGNTYAYGFSCTFDGHVELLGMNSIVLSDKQKKELETRAQTKVLSTFELDGESVAIFQCTITSGNLDTALTDGNGNVYTQAQVLAGAYDNIQYVWDLSSDNRITIAVRNPMAGTWTMTAYDNETADMNCSILADQTLKPRITSTTLGIDKRSITLYYSLENLEDFSDVTLSIFCDAVGQESVGGICIAKVTPDATTGSYTWKMDEEFSGGNYAFHLLAEANGAVPVISGHTGFFEFSILDTEAPNAIAKTTKQWRDTGTLVSWDTPYDAVGVVGYKLRYGTDAENLTEIDLTERQFVFDSLPNGFYYYQIAGYDGAGNCADWSDLEKCFVNTKTNAIYRNQILTEDLTLAGFESAVGLDASRGTIMTEANSLLAASTLGIAELYGIGENLTVNGTVGLNEGALLDGATVNGELRLQANSSADGIIVNSTATHITVNDGGILYVGNLGVVDDVTVKTGASLILAQGADFQNITLERGVDLTISSSRDVSTNKFLLTDDLVVSGHVRLHSNLYGNGHKLYLDCSVGYDYGSELYRSSGYICDMNKIVGNSVTVLVNDDTPLGSYYIAENAQYFNRTLTVQNGTETVNVGYDDYAIIRNRGYVLKKYDDGDLLLKVVETELAAPVISFWDNDTDTRDEFEVCLDSASPNSQNCKWRYSLQSDMSDAATSAVQPLQLNYYTYKNYFTLGKEQFAGADSLYLQVCTQDTNGFWSQWSDAVSVTITQKYLPLAPTITGATLRSTSVVELTADANEREELRYRFRYADNPEMDNAIELSNYGNKKAFIQKSSLELGKTYYAQVFNGAYGWGQVGEFTFLNNADYENYTVTTADGYLSLANNQLAINMTVTAGGWFAIGGTVDGLTAEGGFTRLDEGCHVTDLTVKNGEVWLSQGEVTSLTIEKGNAALLRNTVVHDALIAGTLNVDNNVSTPGLNGTITVQGNILLDAYVNYYASMAEFTFDIVAHNDDKNKAYLSNANVLVGMNTYALRVDDSVEIGDYLLCGNKKATTMSFTLVGTDDAVIAVLSSEDAPVLWEGQYYSVVNANDKTYLHVAENLAPPHIGKVQYYRNGERFGAEDNSYDGLPEEADFVMIGEDSQMALENVGAGCTVKIGADASVYEVTIGSGGKMVLADDAHFWDITVLQGGELEMGKVTMNDWNLVLSGRLTLDETISSNLSMGNFITFELSGMTSPSPDAMISDFSKIGYEVTFDVNVSSQQVNGVYVLADNANDYTSYVMLHVNGNYADGNEVYLVDGSSHKVGNTTYQLRKKDGELQLVVTGGKSNASAIAKNSISASKDGVAWNSSRETMKVVQYSTDNFQTVLEKTTPDNEISTLNLPNETFQWRVRCEDETQWVAGNEFKGAKKTAPALVQAVEDGVEDLFFTSAIDIWHYAFNATNMGSRGGWEGTQETASLYGKNKFGDVLQGTADQNVLFLTDDANGDAIFMEDIYSVNPDALDEPQVRLANIKEIQAGAGDDIVDMTSQRFDYTGNGLIIRGGDGNDTLWANSGKNILFGDAGNDRLVGGQGYDVLVGGSGDDSLHGGGGKDIFCFGEDWGNDTVEQLETGRVTLWFKTGSEANWDAGTMVYSDNGNSVKVSGVAPDRISLKFGDDSSFQYAYLQELGAFSSSSSTSIFRG